VIRVTNYKVLVPKALVSSEGKRIMVIDDTILTGGFMEKMRGFFAHHKVDVRFACCICDNRLVLPGKNPPESIGLLDRLENRMRFPMPWGKDSFCFEDAFRKHHLATQPAPKSSMAGRNA
jgi:hypothetical protein